MKSSRWAKFRTDEQKSHIRLTWDGRLSDTRGSPILPESHTVDAAVAVRKPTVDENFPKPN